MTTRVEVPAGFAIEFTERPRRYTIDGEYVPSVTQVLGVLDKPALKWWSMKTGIEAVVELSRRYGWGEDGLPKNFTDPGRVMEWVKREKLTINSVSRSAADRGVAVHKALERLMEGEVPDPREFPKEDRGYVAALNGWYTDTEPELLAKEVLVGSRVHGFAGRFDLHAQLNGRTARLDLKTGKGIYPEHHLQIEAYELAAVECGYDASDVRLILRLGSGGAYEVQESYAKPEQFLSVLAAFRVVEECKAPEEAAA